MLTLKRVISELIIDFYGSRITGVFELSYRKRSDIARPFIFWFIPAKVFKEKPALFKNNSAWLNYLSLTLGVVIEKPIKINMFLI